MTSSLTQSVSNASRASFAVSTASRAVKQPAVFGSSSTPRSLEHVDERAARLRVDAPQRDGDELGPRDADRLGQRLQAREAAGAEDQARAQRRSSPIVRTSVDRVSSVPCAHPPCMAREHLDARPLADAPRVPLGPRDDLAVDGHRDPAGARLDAEVGEQLGDRRAVAPRAARR